jgi:type I restriction enzyme M protein
MPRRRKPDAAPSTTAQQLGSLIKSARDKMREDKGLSTDLDRLPMLTWIMFLKFLDDKEEIEASRAKMREERFRPSIEPPYRWRDWAASETGIKGPELLAFINQDEAVRPDGTRGPGLFAYLRNLHDGERVADRRKVIATVFRGVVNRMTSGYLLREVINKVNGIRFLAQEELFTLGHFYETMLREMRDAAGENGEFYTPRPVVRFMVEVTNPRLGETFLDPACGTGGFLAEAFTHLAKQCKTVEHRRTLQEDSLFGGEAKPLPYLLCQMNLLLHGLEAPQIDPENSLRFPLMQLGDRDRVDVVLTNPPFGGKEERGILGNFPEDKQTAETALLFLQLIMRKIRRVPKPGRAAVVVPNGTLFGDGVCARIKEELLKEFNLHTIVRLPNGVFSPYTGIPTNVLFFDRSGPTQDVWYYEHPLPEGRKNYTKTQPLQFEEFAPLIAWWKHREENDRAWKVPAAELLANNCNLDRKNPHAKEDITHLPPEQLAASILKKEQRIAEIMGNIQNLLEKTKA